MFNRTTETLPALQASTAVSVGSRGSALVTSQSVSKSVQRGVLQVMLAFPRQGLPDADARVVRDLLIEAVEGFPQAVVEWSLKFLVFNNPRNTPTFSCPPTPQDVREACQATQNCWEYCIYQYYFEGVWATPPSYQLMRNNNSAILDRYYAAHKGGKPGEPGCLIPDDLQIVYLLGAIERQLPDIESERRNRDDILPQLLMIEDRLLDGIPDAAFPSGALEMIRAKRAARAAAAAKAAEHQAYLRSLSEEVRVMRSLLIASLSWESEDENEIRSVVDRRLEEFHAAKRGAEKDGGELLGMTFADGGEVRERDVRRLSAAARGAL